MTPLSQFGIVGAGAWGTALAMALHRAGTNVTLWARDPGLAEQITSTHENGLYLPGIKLDPAIKTTGNLKDMASCQALILAMPAQYARSICKELATFYTGTQPLVIAAKGIELSSHRLLSEVVATEMPGHPVFVLSGPSFAAEVAASKPTALTLASEADCENVAHAIASPLLRIYTSDDIIGTQIGGAIKNVLAIACGIVAGRQMGENARAALITRGLAEIVRLAIALGARAETVTGLSGLGDIVLSCSSAQSRNMSLGFALGQGQKLADILASRTCVTEGVATAAAALGLAHHHGVDMPVVKAVDSILRENANIDEMISGLLARPSRAEAA